MHTSIALTRSHVKERQKTDFKALWQPTGETETWVHQLLPLILHKGGVIEPALGFSFWRLQVR